MIWHVRTMGRSLNSTCAYRMLRLPNAFSLTYSSRKESKMTAITRADSLRSAGHPVYSDRKLRLGTFSTNVNGGCTATTIDGVLAGDWPSTSKLAQLADEMEFEALVPVGRWRGFGGKTDFNGTGFESFT